jgi:multidrug efflux pump subunit AcrA (membrane-fusion protein)
VRVQPVRYNNEATAIVAYGRVNSAQPITITAEAQGRLYQGEVPLKPAERFRAGQRLFRIDSEEMRLNLRSQKSKFLQIMAAALPDLRLDYPERYPKWKAFYDSIEIHQPLPQLPTVQSAAEKTFIASQNILSQYYSIKSTADRLRKYSYKTPYPGTISKVHQEIGSIVTPGTKIAEILRTDRMEVELPIRVSNIQWLRRGATVELTAEQGNETWQGQIQRIGNYVDQETQTVNVYVVVRQDPENELYEGRYLRARIPGKTVKDVFPIPRKAVINNQFVWQVQGGELKQQPVQVHRVRGEMMLISGPAEGSHVLVNPPVTARKGMRVRMVMPEDTAARGPQASAAGAGALSRSNGAAQ